ncbi:MAG: hypothetical protein AAAB17_20775, partial [Pseudomonas sp.]
SMTNNTFHCTSLPEGKTTIPDTPLVICFKSRPGQSGLSHAVQRAASQTFSQKIGFQNAPI